MEPITGKIGKVHKIRALTRSVSGPFCYCKSRFLARLPSRADNRSAACGQHATAKERNVYYAKEYLQLGIIMQQKQKKKSFIITGILFFLFLFFTVLVMTADVQLIGPEQSVVGLASINRFVLIFSVSTWFGTALPTGWALLPQRLLLGLRLWGSFRL